MDIRNDSTMKGAVLSAPSSAKPGTSSPGGKVMNWLSMGCITGLIVFYTIRSLTQGSDTWSFLTTLFGVFMLWGIWSNWVATAQRKRRDTFISTYQFPARIKEQVGNRYPHLSNNELILVMQGLRQYFQLCNTSMRETVSMPSRVVDVAWHEFILFTRNYNEFCRQGIGRFLHHIPAEGTVSPGIIEDGLKKAWLLACEWEGIDQKSPSRLPFLFLIDEALRIPDGFIHSLDNDYATKGGAACGSGGCGGGCGGGC